MLDSAKKYKELSYPSWLYKIIEKIFIKEDVDPVMNNL